MYYCQALLGDRRTVFAWLPFRRWSDPRPYTKPDGFYWLRNVTQTFTLMEGWVAYAGDNDRK